MTNNEGKNRTGEFPKIPGPGSEGIAGPSRDVLQCERQLSSTAEGAGRETGELAWAQRHIPRRHGPVVQNRNPRPRLVQRKTEIIGCGVPAGTKRTSVLKEKAEHLSIDIPAEVLENNGDLIFLLLDHMHRIAERQDRKIDRVSRRISALEERERSP